MPPKSKNLTKASAQKQTETLLSVLGHHGAGVQEMNSYYDSFEGKGSWEIAFIKLLRKQTPVFAQVLEAHTK